jgi:predicted exporter
LNDGSGPGIEARAGRLAAWLWLVLLAALALSAWGWWRDPGGISSDLLALLPEEAMPAVARQAQSRLVAAAERRLVILVGGGELAAALRAAERAHETLAAGRLFANLLYSLDADRLARWQGFYAAHRHLLLTDGQRERLREGRLAELLDEALAWLYGPVGLPGALPLREDPLLLFGGWQMERGRESRLRPVGGHLVATEGERHYVAILAELSDSPFGLELQRGIVRELAAARAAARAAEPAAELLAAGVVLHAAEAAAQAEREISLIGFGSLLGTLGLTYLAFGSLRPLLLAQLPILAGCVAAVSLAALLFGRLHLLTLVFGASLLGVAVDYGLHYLCHLGREESLADRRARLRALGPGIFLAWVTTAVAYLAMAIPPFPGLRQMALFSFIGLLFAWLTVLVWLPRLARSGLRPEGRLVRGLIALPARWPRFHATRRGALLLLLLGVAVAGGLWRLRVDDDIRLLQASSPARLAEEQRVAALTGAMPSGRFLVVEAGTVEGVLEREEGLRRSLDRLQAAGRLAGYQALSLWVPSAARQREQYALLAERVYAAGGRMEGLLRERGVPAAWLAAARQSHAAAAEVRLELDRWLADPVSEPLRHLWLGRTEGRYASVVTVQGVRGADGPAAIQAAVATAPGVLWVDRVAELSGLLGSTRRQMAAAVGAGYLLVLAALLGRYGRPAWRVIAPTAVASLGTLASCGWWGVPVNLFVVLALLLVLGIGIDYGIYLQEAGSRLDASWVGVCLSALTTMLSFGLLSFSRVPALHAFGLVVLLGVGLSWLLAPCFAGAEEVGRRA